MQKHHREALIYECTCLNSISIPDSVTSIGVGAFNGCSNLTIKGYDGSYAETYAIEIQIPFQSIGNVTKDKRGELDGKEGVSADDAQTTLMAAVNILANRPSGLTAEQELAADVNESGTITAEDAQYILIYAIQALANKNPQWSDIIK